MAHFNHQELFGKCTGADHLTIERFPIYWQQKGLNPLSRGHEETEIKIDTLVIITIYQVGDAD